MTKNVFDKKIVSLVTDNSRIATNVDLAMDLLICPVCQTADIPRHAAMRQLTIVISRSIGWRPALIFFRTIMKLFS